MNQTIFFGQKECCNSFKEETSCSSLDAATATVGGQTCCSISSKIDSSNVENICEDKIREKAYFLWEEAGRPECDGVDFWVEAKNQLSLSK